MTRLAPGIYHVINESGGNETREIMVDNELMVLHDATTVTVIVKNVLEYTPISYLHITRLSGNLDSIQGNATKWQA